MPCAMDAAQILFVAEIDGNGRGTILGAVPQTIESNNPEFDLPISTTQRSIGLVPDINRPTIAVPAGRIHCV